MRCLVPLMLLYRYGSSCAATSGTATTTTVSSVTTTSTAAAATTTTTTTACGTCTANQIVLTPASAAVPGSTTPILSAIMTDPATGCLTINAICTGQAGFFSFMQFNVNQGGPKENEGMTQVVTAPLECINGQWYYDQVRAVNEVNCLEAPQPG